MKNQLIHYAIIIWLSCWTTSCGFIEQNEEPEGDLLANLQKLRTDNPDSARNVLDYQLNKAPYQRPDSIRAQLYLEWSILEVKQRSFSEADSLSSIILNERLEATLDQKARAYHVKGQCAYFSGRFEESISFFETGLELNPGLKEELRLKSGIVNTLFFTRKPQEALELTFEIRMGAEELKDTALLLANAFTAALCYQSLDAFDLAVKELDYYVSIHKGKLHGRKSLNIYGALANQYSKLGQMHKSNAMLRKAIRASRSIKDEMREVVNLSGFVNNYTVLNQLDSAWAYLDSLNAMQHSAVQPWASVSRDLQKARLLMADGQLLTAETLLKTGLEKAEEIGFLQKITDYEVLLARVMVAQEKYKSSIQILERSMEDKSKWAEKNQLTSANEVLSSAFLGLGDTLKAKQYSANATTLKDESRATINLLKTAAIEHRLQVEMLSAQLAMKEQIAVHVRRQVYFRNIIILVTSLLIVALLVIVFLSRRSQLFKRQKLELEMEQVQHEKLIVQQNLVSTTEAYDEKRQELLVAEKELLAVLKKLRELQSPQDIDPKATPLPSFSADKLEFETQWKTFEMLLNSTYNGFTEKAKSQYANLSSQDLRILSLIRAGLDSKEIATVMGIAHASVNKNRYRIRKKMNLTKDSDLFSELLKIA